MTKFDYSFTSLINCFEVEVDLIYQLWTSSTTLELFVWDVEIFYAQDH